MIDLQQLVNKIDEMWVGVTAEEFKNKVLSDKDKFCRIMDTLYDRVETDVKQMEQNVRNADAQIAANIGVAIGGGGGTGISYGNSGSNSSYSNSDSTGSNGSSSSSANHTPTQDEIDAKEELKKLKEEFHIEDDTTTESKNEIKDNENKPKEEDKKEDNQAQNEEKKE